MTLGPAEAVFGIDPGNELSAFVLLRGDGRILEHGKVANPDLLARLNRSPFADLYAVERITSMGMIAGASTFDTAVFIGEIKRTLDVLALSSVYLARVEIKKRVTGSVKTNDSDVRRAMIARYGAPGTKSQPGPTFGISADQWSALAVATVAASGEFKAYIPFHLRAA